MRVQRPKVDGARNTVGAERFDWPEGHLQAKQSLDKVVQRRQSGSGACSAWLVRGAVEEFGCRQARGGWEQRAVD